MSKKIACILLALWFAQYTILVEYAWASVATGAAHPALTQSASASSGELPELPRVSLPAAGIDLPELMQTAYDVADQYPVADYFIEEKLIGLEFDPANAFRFVRDEIRHQPYYGQLRGAQGALSARAGNALDRSLLLSELLEGMGYDTRVAQGQIATEHLQGWQRSLEWRGPEGTDKFKPLAALAGFSEPIMQRLQARAQRDYTRLRSALAEHEFNADVSPPAPGKHYWVQARLDGEWTDLDTVFTQAEPGDRFGEVETYLKEVPAALQHQVELEIVAESLAGDSVKEQLLLEKDFSAAEMNHRNIFLTFAPQNPSLGGLLFEKFGGQLIFVPVLTVDDDVTNGKPLPGITAPKSESEEFLFGSGKSGELTALYMDVHVTLPGAEPTTERRVLIDRIPPAHRRSGALSPEDLYPVNLDSGAPADMQAIHQVVVSTGALNPHEIANNVGLSLYFVKQYILDDPDSLDTLPLSSVLWPVGNMRMTPLFIMEQYAAAAVSELTGLAAYIGSPRVYLFSESPDPRNGELRLRQSIDLLRDDIDLVTGAGGEQAVIDAQMAYGVLQTAFETTLAEMPWMLTTETELPVFSASSALDTGTPAVISKTDESGLPAAVPAAAHADLAAGRLILTSDSMIKDASRFAWWSVARDGSTKGRIRSGLGGVDTYLGWKHYVDARKGRIFQIGSNPQGYSDLSKAQQRQLMRDAVRSVENSETWEEYKKRDHKRRVAKRSGKLPRAASNCNRGHTEYTLTNCTSIWMTMSGATFFGIILAATFAGAILLFVAFTAVLKAVRE